jgi:putative ABC transport system permease protein
MFIQDAIAQALSALNSQRLRTGLILLAMSIGVASMNVLTALAESARRYIVHEFETLGTHLIIVLPGRAETTGGAPPLLGETPRDLTLDDAEALQRSRYVNAIAPLTIGAAPVSAGGLERDTDIFGSTAALKDVRHLTVTQGVFLPGDNRPLPVCVIGKTIHEQLFAGKAALGQWLRINDRRFRVIGILAPEGESVGVDFDEMVIIPVTQAQALFNTRALFRILVQSKSEAGVPRAVSDINTIIKMRHEGEDDFTIITQDSVVTTFNKILIALTLAVTFITGISLIVAGVLVMNVMFVSVSQRTAEIGLLKALGATRRQLCLLFLAEAALLSFIGALAGLAFGELIIAGIRLLYPVFPIRLPYWALILSVAVSMATGLIFGLLPAVKAAKLEPVTALGKK